MDTQQCVAMMIVGVALVYLGRQFVTSAKSFFANKSGCGGGCSKCAFAEQRPANQKSGNKTMGTAGQGNVIALGDIKMLPRREK